MSRLGKNRQWKKDKINPVQLGRGLPHFDATFTCNIYI